MFKLLAIFFMTLDHLAFVFAPAMPSYVYLILRSIGRLAFPMFVWEFARGYHRSKNLMNYFLRLLVLASFTQGLFFLADIHFVNVMFTFTFSLAILANAEFLWATLRMIKNKEDKVQLSYYPEGLKTNPFLGLLIPLMIILGFGFAIYKFHPDYNFYGLALSFACVLIARPLPKKPSNLQALKTSSITFISILTISLIVYFFRLIGEIQLLAALAALFIPIELKDKKPSKFMKYFFYVYYPLHLVILAIIFKLVQG